MFHIYRCPTCNSSLCSQLIPLTERPQIVPFVNIACPNCKVSKNYNFVTSVLATTPGQVRAFKASNQYQNCVATDIDVVKKPK